MNHNITSIEEKKKYCNFLMIDMIIHIENARESTDKHLEQTQIHQYTKHQISIKTPVIFLYDSKKKEKRKNKTPAALKKIPFTLVKNI